MKPFNNLDINNFIDLQGCLLPTNVNYLEWGECTIEISDFEFIIFSEISNNKFIINIEFIDNEMVLIVLVKPLNILLEWDLDIRYEDLCCRFEDAIKLTDLESGDLSTFRRTLYASGVIFEYTFKNRKIIKTDDINIDINN
jgi:hypothetical protein